MRKNKYFFTLMSIPVKVLLSLCTGILLSLSQPPARVQWFIWIAFLPLFFVLFRSSLLQSMIYSFLSGFIFYSLSFQWTSSFHPFALPFISVVWGVLFFMVPLIITRAFLHLPRFYLVAVPSIWVFVEYIRQSWFLKFPFGILGYTQYHWPRLIQIADITGVLGISWIIMLINVLIFRIVILFLYSQYKEHIKTLCIHSSIILFTFSFLLLYGTIQFACRKYNPEECLKAGYAQTLFHPKAKWQDHYEEYFAIIEDMAGHLSGLDTDLILFPELTIERTLTLDNHIKLKENAEILNRLSTAAKSNLSSILFGGIELVKINNEIKRFNTTFLFGKDGSLTGLYRKQVLVPFGEFYPFGTLFPGLKEYILSTTDAAELTPGTRSEIFKVKNKNNKELTFGVLTCFESGYAGIAREYARKNVHFLVNVTNDYWSLSSIAVYQHAVIAVFRAIETKKPVLRISNGGYSCFINEFGKYSSTIPVFKKGLMTVIIRLLANPGQTVYTKFGDWLVPACLVVFFICIGFIFLKGYRKPALILSKLHF